MTQDPDVTRCEAPLHLSDGTVEQPVPTVLVVDDDVAVRRSFYRLLRSAGMDVRTYASPDALLGDGLPASPACLVLDVCMDEMSGLQVLDALRGHPRHLPVVFVSGQATVTNVAAAFKAGAQDFLEKPVKPNELLEAVWRALENDASHASRRAKLDDMRRRLDLLTPREYEVMEGMAAGFLNKQIAYRLGISEKTVKVHRARVFDKMEVVSLAPLVHVVHELGVVTGSEWSGADELRLSTVA